MSDKKKTPLDERILDASITTIFVGLGVIVFNLFGITLDVAAGVNIVIGGFSLLALTFVIGLAFHLARNWNKIRGR